MKIKYLGQSGYIIKTKNSEIIIDPYLSDSVNRAAGRPRLLPVPVKPQDISCDAVICTHDHLDHLDPDTISQIPEGQLFVTTSGGKTHLEKLDRTNVKALHIGESLTIGDYKLTAVYANHTVEAFGLIIEAEGKTLYFSGDTLYDEKLFEIAAYRPDITFICINGRLGNMNVDEALTVAKEIGAKTNIPNHYDMFASNSENPHLFSDCISGGIILDFNKQYTF